MCFCQGIWSVLDSIKSGHTDKITCSLMGYWHVLEYNLKEDKLKHPGKMDGKIRCSGKDLHNYWDNMVFLWGFCLLPEKITFFFSILNKSLPIVARNLEVLCRIIEYRAKSISSEFIYCRRISEFLRERIPSCLTSGKIIWEKSTILWE